MSVASGDPAGSRGGSTRSGAGPGAHPSAGASAGGRCVAGSVGGLYRCVARGAGTAAGCGCGPVASSAGALGTAAPGGTGLGVGRTADGSTDDAGDDAGPPAAGVTAASELTGAGGFTGTADTVGAGATGETERLCAVMSSTATAPPVSAKHPPAATSLPQRCRPWACRRNASQGSSSASGGLSAGGSVGCAVCAVWNNGAALVALAGAARSAPIRSRRARNSSIASIWSASDSSTTSPNGASCPLDAEIHADGLSVARAQRIVRLLSGLPVAYSIFDGCSTGRDETEKYWLAQAGNSAALPHQAR